MTRVILSLLCGLLSVATAADWPNWLGPDETGKSNEVLPESVSLTNIRWQAEVGIGFSSFSIADGKVFTMGHSKDSETVWCLSESSGEVIWKHTYPAELMPNLHEGGPNATPTIDGDRVYAISKDGQLHCYSIKDGVVLWKKNMLKEAAMYRPPEWGYGGSPYIVDNLVIIESGATFAYDKVSGNEVWRSRKYRPAYGSPRLFKSGDASYLATLKTDGLVILDPANGETLGFSQWRTSFQTNANTPLEVADGQLFVSTGYDRGCALFGFDGSQLVMIYEAKTMSNHMGNSVLLDGYLYGFDGTAHRGRSVEFCCVKLKDGSKQWSTQEYKYGSVIAAGDDLIVLTESGEMLVGKANPKGFKARTSRRILDGRCWTPPAISNGIIYARNAGGHVVAIQID